MIIRINDTLLPADSMYRYWPDELKRQVKTVQQLIVPHHGSNLNKYDRQENLIKEAWRDNKAVIDNLTNLECAVVCCGKVPNNEKGDEKYKHPVKKHMEYLSDALKKAAKTQNVFKVQGTGGKIITNKERNDPHVDIKNDDIILTV